MSAPFLCGVVEGFYGRPWSHSQRCDLFECFAAWQLNAYMYAPKDDKKHRARWRELYSAEEIDKLAFFVNKARTNRVEFIYALSPGLDIRYSNPLDQDFLIAKLSQLAGIGCTNFAVLFDDIEFAEPMTEQDRATFPSPAHAQSFIANLIFDRLSATNPHVRVLFCPTEYCADRIATADVTTSPYLRDIGNLLHSEIGVFWTGPRILSPTIDVVGIDQLISVLHRKPIIWDNLHANDYDQRRVYLGPYTGRPAQLREKLGGILSNPNTEYPCNFVPLRTLARWHQDGATYNPRQAYRDACEEWKRHFVLDVVASPGLVTAPENLSVTTEEVMMLGDTLYLPYEHGDWASSLYHEFVWLAEHPIMHPDWHTRRSQFDEETMKFVHLFSKLTEMDNRDLLYSLYSYAWDIKEIVLIIRVYIKWRGDGEPGGSFSHREITPKTWVGGLLADFHRLLPMNQTTGTIRYRPLDREPPAYVIRPYCQSDLAAVYEVCLKTGDSGADGTHLFPQHPTVLGERWCGAYVHLEPQFAFVLEDDTMVCGYVLGVLNSKAFYQQMELNWLPQMRAIYPRPVQPDASPADEVIESFYTFSPTTWERFFAKYPSHLHIDLAPKAQGKRLGNKMIELLLQRLQAAGSCGVHLQMSPTNHRALHFYKKFGFEELFRDENDLILGKSFTK